MNTPHISILTLAGALAAMTATHSAEPPEFKWREVEIDTIEMEYGLQLTGVDGDGKTDVVAAARQTKNLKIFFAQP